MTSTTEQQLRQELDDCWNLLGVERAETMRLRQRVMELEEGLHFQACLTRDLMPYQERAVKAEKELAELRKAQGELEVACECDRAMRKRSECACCVQDDKQRAQGEPVAVVKVHRTFDNGGVAWSATPIDGPKVHDGELLYRAAVPSDQAQVSREPDLHTPGIYVVLDADGAPVPGTLATTGYSARSTFIREKNMLWSKAQAEGYRVVELVPK